jgi:hypothetical protein
MMKNLDFFDGETEVSSKPDFGHMNTYQRTKARNHYRKSFSKENKCKNCEFCLSGNYHNKRYYKCKFIGVSNSPATDIKVNNVCDLYKRDSSL